MTSISAAEAYKIYYNYWAKENSLGTSNATMATICYEYKDQLETWKQSLDTTSYEIDDSDFIEEGRKAAETATEYDGDNTGQKVGTGFSCAAGVLGAGYSVVNLGNTIKGVKSLCGTEATTAAKFDGISTSTTKASDLNAGDWSTYIAAGIAIEEAIRFWSATYGRDKKIADALTELTTMMGKADTQLSNIEATLNNTENTITSLNEEGEYVNAEGNYIIEDNTTDFLATKQCLDELDEKIKNGSATESEKASRKDLVELLQTNQGNIEDTKEETSDLVNSINDDLSDQAGIFDETAESMGYIEGVTSYAAGFDESANTNFMLEGYAQVGNAASGATAGIKLLATSGIAWWQYVIGGAAIAAGVSSGLGASKEFSNATISSNEVTARQGVQQINEETKEVHSSIYDYYGGVQGSLAGLELLVDDDVLETEIDDPEEPETTSTNTNTQDKNNNKKVKT